LTRTLTSSKRHILVVEDNIINQKVLTRQLQSRGFKTSVAADGQEALNLIQATGFDGDLILMDIVRSWFPPRYSLITVYRKCRSRTARLPAESFDNGRASGRAQDYLSLRCTFCNAMIVLRSYLLQDWKRPRRAGAGLSRRWFRPSRNGKSYISHTTSLY